MRDKVKPVLLICQICVASYCVLYLLAYLRHIFNHVVSVVVWREMSVGPPSIIMHWRWWTLTLTSALTRGWQGWVCHEVWLRQSSHSQTDWHWCRETQENTCTFLYLHVFPETFFCVSLQHVRAQYLVILCVFAAQTKCCTLRNWCGFFSCCAWVFVCFHVLS